MDLCKMNPIKKLLLVVRNKIISEINQGGGMQLEIQIFHHSLMLAPTIHFEKNLSFLIHATKGEEYSSPCEYVCEFRLLSVQKLFSLF